MWEDQEVYFREIIEPIFPGLGRSAMWEDQEVHFREIIEPIFPGEAEIRRDRELGDCLAFHIDWRLGNDPERPNKRSRPIRLVLTREAMEDFLALPPVRRAVAEARLRDRVQALRAGFDPDHGHPRYMTVPPVTWTIGSDLLG